MRAATDIFIILSFILAVAGCNNRSKFGQRLASLDSVLVSNPDSVYRVLTGMEKDVNDQSESDRMYYDLLRADAQNKAYIDFTTDSVMLDVVEYYDRHGSANEQMRAHYLLGCTYRDLGDAPMELQCFHHAVEKADTTSETCDLYTLVAIYGQIADIYSSQHLPDEELKVLTECEKIALLDKDTLSAIKCYELRVRAYSQLNNQDSVLSISFEAFRRYSERGYTMEASSLLSPVIGILVERKQYDEAIRYLKIYENYLDENADALINKYPVVYNHEKGLLLLENNQVDSALICFNKLLSENESEAAYHGLLSLYEKLNEPDSIAKYAKLYAAANDSSHSKKNSELIAQLSVMYDYGRHEKIAKDKSLESTKAKATAYSIAIVSISILFILSIIVVILRYKIKDRERVHKEQEKLLLSRYNETKDIIFKLEREKSVLKTENYDKEKLIKEIKKYEKEKHELEVKLKEVSRLSDSVDFKAWYEDLIVCNATNILHTKTIIVPNHVVEIEDELWDELRRRISQRCPAFLRFLDSYSLSPMYYKIALLNTFDFTNSDISILLNKTNQQVSNIHNRLSKKMFPSCKETRRLKKNIQQILMEKRS